MRLRLALICLGIAASPSAQARTIWPEWMAAFDLAHVECRDGSPDAAKTLQSCRARYDYAQKLRAAGFELTKDPSVPSGFGWDIPSSRR